MVPAGYAVAEEQIVLREGDFAMDGKAIQPEKKGGRYVAENISFAVSPETGALTSLVSAGQELLASPMTISLFRPLTENDAHRKGSGKLWTDAGLDGLKQKATSVHLKGKSVVAHTELTGKDGQKVGYAQLQYTPMTSGVLEVCCTVVPDTSVVKSLPRIGLTYQTPAALATDVDYLGRNGETYVDRNTAGRIAQHSTTPKADYHNYIVPQACGNHTDVRTLAFNDNLLTISSDAHFQFSAVPYSDQLLMKAKHINDLYDEGLVTVHLDAAQTGVGTATCGPDVLPKYRIPVQPTEFTFYFKTK